jgi:hypothetical protein
MGTRPDAETDVQADRRLPHTDGRADEGDCWTPDDTGFHRPISAYVNALVAAGFVVDRMLELADMASGQTPRRAKRRTGNLDIPLFLAIRGVHHLRT